jgi:putative DNA primase/helicase
VNVATSESGPVNIELLAQRKNEIERAVLGAIIVIGNGSMSDAVNLGIGSDDFLPHHACTFRVCQFLHEQKKDYSDPALVKDELLRREELDLAGGPAGIGKLMDAADKSANLPQYVATLKMINSDWNTREADQALAADGDVEKHTDSGVANMERLVKQHHRDVRSLYRVGWYSWDKRRFAPDAEADLVRRAIRTIRGMYHEAATIEDQKERESFLAHIRRSESEPEIRRMLLLAQSHENVYVPKPEHFDRDPMLLNLHNGTLDLRTRVLHPHRREDQITKLAGCAYDPKADCPTWDGFLDTVFDGNADVIGFVQRLVGYCLTGEVREHVLPIFWGEKAPNGKSTLLRTLLNLMGEYGTPAPRDLLVVRKHAAHETELMVLMGARLAVAVETPMGAYLAETLVKHLTGNDAIKARLVFKNFVTFLPSHKLLMATNHKPRVQETDTGIWRRLLLIPFTITIAPEDQDVHLIDKLALELPGILNWAVQGCADWQEAGLCPPRAVQDATSGYRAESDHLPTFMEESCVLGPHAKVEKGTIFVEYTRWCERSGEAPMPKVELGRRFRALGVTEEKSNSRRYWSGIGLVPKDQTVQEGQ